jgi:hypothetical protein
MSPTGDARLDNPAADPFSENLVPNLVPNSPILRQFRRTQKTSEGRSNRQNPCKAQICNHEVWGSSPRAGLGTTP